MGAVMELNAYSLLGALIFLILGIFELIVIQRLVYPALRWRYEEAKVTQTQGTDPSRILFLLRVQSLVFMPVIGLLFGGPLKSMFGGVQ
jgi:hypothetical protein